VTEPDPPDVAHPRLDAAEIDALAPLGARRRLHDGERLFGAGERRGGFYVVLAGEVEVLDHSGDEPRSIAVHGPGPFTWIDVDEEDGIREALRDFGVGETDLPVVAAGGRPLMRAPSIRELAETGASASTGSVSTTRRRPRS
jgi:hypothetical protein